MSSSKFKGTVADYEYGLEVKARWSPIVEGAGLYNDAQDAMTVFLLAGSIIDDAIYTERLLAKLAATEGEWPDAILLGPDVLAEMTPAERKGLRARVLAKWGKK